MKALLNIKLTNDAFTEGPQELANILKTLAVKLESEGYDEETVIFLRDVNGNTVGKIRFIKENER